METWCREADHQQTPVSFAKAGAALRDMCARPDDGACVGRCCREADGHFTTPFSQNMALALRVNRTSSHTCPTRGRQATRRIVAWSPSVRLRLPYVGRSVG